MTDIARDLNCERWQEIMGEESFTSKQEDQVWQILDQLISLDHEENKGLHWGVYNILGDCEMSIQDRIKNLESKISDFKSGNFSFDEEEHDLYETIETDVNQGLGECEHCDRPAVIDAGDYGNLCEDCYEQYVGE